MQPRIDGRLVISAIGAAGTMAGSIALVALNGTDTFEGRFAFWLFLVLFFVLLMYAAAPLYLPPSRVIRRSVYQWRYNRKARSQFPDWISAWNDLMRVLTQVVERRYSGYTDMPKSLVRRYREIRQLLQQQSPVFLNELEGRVTDRLRRTVVGTSAYRWNLDEYVAGSGYPFRVFYSEPDLKKLRDGLCPSFSDMSSLSRDEDWSMFKRTRDRIDDIILEFAAERGLSGR